MKRIIAIFCLCLLSHSLFSQTIESAKERMNKGDYGTAKIYWEALDDESDRYASEIELCGYCETLQKEAKQLVSSHRYSKAIEKYQSILNLNPSDTNARSRIAECQRLRDLYLAANKLQTYSNQHYGYSIKYPSDIAKDWSSTDEKVVFHSKDNRIYLTVTATIEYKKLTDSQIIDRRIKQYNSSKVANKRLGNTWFDIRGNLPSGKSFYEKTVVVNRKSQYGEAVKVIISAILTTSKNDNRLGRIAENINQTLNVDKTCRMVLTSETDDERFQKALGSNTIEGYTKYLAYATTSSKHLKEAKARRSILDARESYKKGFYEDSKALFESGSGYLSNEDEKVYADCCYRHCRDFETSVDELKDFIHRFPDHPMVKVIKGRIVKAYCSKRYFSSARLYVKNNYKIWFDENQSFSKRQWMKYIRQCKRGITSVYGDFPYSSKSSKSDGKRKALSVPKHAVPPYSVASNNNSSNIRIVYSKNVSLTVGETIKACINGQYVTRWEISKSSSDYVRASGDELTAFKQGTTIIVWGYIDSSPKLFTFSIVTEDLQRTSTTTVSHTLNGPPSSQHVY